MSITNSIVVIIGLYFIINGISLIKNKNVSSKKTLFSIILRLLMLLNIILL